MLNLWKAHWRWKVRDLCHVTGKFRDAAHWSCKKLLIELKKLDVKIDIIPNELKKYMAFIKNKNLLTYYLYWQYAVYEF